MTAPIPDKELASLRRLHEQATPGPWQTRFMYRALQAARKDAELMFGTAPESDWPDAEFIAAARNALPGLLERLRRLEEAVDAAIPATDADDGPGPYVGGIRIEDVRALRAARAAAKGEAT
jgi:hypothetical protein